MKTDIFVFIDSVENKPSKFIGILSSNQTKGHTIFSFEYDKEFLKTESSFLLDPEIGWFSGKQYPTNKEIFGIFADSMPDTWGRTLMKRRAIQFQTGKDNKKTQLFEKDYLLGVFDESRIGALRYKLDINGNFLDNTKSYSTPPWSSIGELQHSAKALEDNTDDYNTNWLHILIAPGSTLGGARPKANILDKNNQIWIAKFPSNNDVIDKAKWEFLAHKLAIDCGVIMSECKIEKIGKKHHTFFTKRFDRTKEGNRVNYASAMTMTANNELSLKDNTASYLDIAEFIQFNNSDNTADLHQLWRRIVFNICVSNTDDHLRNHGFLLKDNNWKLSPAFDINPSVDKLGLSLNINSDDNKLDLQLAKSVGKYFQLNDTMMGNIIEEVNNSVMKWRDIANKLKISKSEQELMKSAFLCDF
jgi:serine/threonine-protein kinase HipA